MSAEEELRELRVRVEALERRLGMYAEPVRAPEQPPVVFAPAPQIAPPAEPPPTPSPTTTEHLETRIGAHWLNRIGIAAVLTGAAFFLKYAFENNWIGPAMRVSIGIACGIGVIVMAEVMRKRGHDVFAHSLDVIGAGILYLSIWAASQIYALLPDGAAFGSMVVVTAGVVALAIRHRSQFLAAVAFTGGFMTPILLASRGDHEIALFAYVALLDAAALVLVVLFPWLRALAVAFLGTLFLYVAWAAQHYEPAVMHRTIGFATLFFVLFAVVPLLRRWDEEPASQLVLALPLVNAIVYFAQLSHMLHREPETLAWYAVGLAAFSLALAAALAVRRDREDLAAAHIALAIGFVTIAIPLALNERWITLGWLAESAALIALAPRLTQARARVFHVLAGITLTLGVLRLLFIDHFVPERLLLNSRTLAYAIAISVFALVARTRDTALAKFAMLCGNALALIELTLEASDFFNHWQGRSVAAHSLARDFTWSALWMIYGAALMTFGFRRHSSFLRWLALALIGFTACKVFLYDMNELERVYRILSFIALGVLLLAISLAYQRKWISLDAPDA